MSQSRREFELEQLRGIAKEMQEYTGAAIKACYDHAEKLETAAEELRIAAGQAAIEMRNAAGRMHLIITGEVN